MKKSGLEFKVRAWTANPSEARAQSDQSHPETGG